MIVFLLRFWPVFIPLIVYWVWLKYVGRKATIEGRPVLKFSEGPWYWMLLSSLLIGLGCFLLVALEIEPHKGEYVPPRLENGVVVPAEIKP